MNPRISLFELCHHNIGFKLFNLFPSYPQQFHLNNILKYSKSPPLNLRFSKINTAFAIISCYVWGIQKIYTEGKHC